MFIFIRSFFFYINENKYVNKSYKNKLTDNLYLKFNNVLNE